MPRNYPITERVTVHSVERLNNSVNGNPRFKLITDNGIYISSSDASGAYDVENVTRKLPVTVTLALTPSGRFYDIWES